MKYLSDRYVKVITHKCMDICTLKVAIPFQGDEMGYVIDDARFSGAVFNHPEDAIDEIDSLIRIYERKNMKKNNIKCSECEFCKGYKGRNAERKGFHCEHENSEYIREYFETHKISKMQGFIAFGEIFSDKPSIKTSPTWCPRKAKLN